MQLRREVLRDGPALYYPLNELSGTTAFDLGTVGNGTYNGANLRLGHLPFPGGGRAPWFAASSQYVSRANSVALSPASTSAYTVEAWYYSDTTVSTGGRRCIVSKVGPSDYEWLLYHESDSFYGTNTWNWDCLTAAGGDHLTCLGGNGSAQPGRWWHLVGTVVPSTRADLYVNGRLVATDTTSSGSMTAEGSILTIGDDSLTGATNFSVAHVALYQYVLSQDRILAHTRAGFGQTQRSAFATRRVA